MKGSESLSTATQRRRSPDSSATPPPERFTLDGPSRLPDPRTHAYRPDIADVALAGQLFAPHYARAQTCFLTSDSAMVRAAPSDNAQAVSQLVRGEGFDVLDRSSGWAWGKCLHDDYVGYLPAAALGHTEAATHRVTAPIAPLFAQPDIKAPVLASWPIGACVAGEAAGDFVATQAGFLHARHVAALGDRAADPVAVAERLLGQPYLWGGRGAGGIDCSGLVQIALAAAGHMAPRDSDMQRGTTGEILAEDAALRRGDLVFFPGHVGLMADGEHMIHANAYWMEVVIEPLADVVARLRPAHAQPILARRRVSA